MSLTSSAHHLPSNYSPSTSQDLSFHHQPTYITLSRTLSRLSNALLPLALSTTNPTLNLTPHEAHTLQTLLSPLPYHRLKTLHTIEHARTLLLQLEQSANNIRIQRIKRDVVKDLAEKRKVLRRLRGVVEELGREAERRRKEKESGRGYGERGGRNDGYEDEEEERGETVEELLGLPPLDGDKNGDKRNATVADVRENGQEGGSAVKDQRPPSSPERDPISIPSTSTLESPAAQNYQQLRNDRFSSTTTTTTSNLRNRRPNTQSPNNNKTTATSSSPSHTSTKSTLRHDRQTQTSLTSSLLQLAQQLRSQSESLSTTLTTTDASKLQAALAGLDSNVSGLEAASRKMGFLKRMSEGEGWWGRLMLYAWIVGGWVVAVLLVFVGPKFRF